MPELPDVQVYKEYIDATSLHRRIDGVQVDAGRMRQGVSDRTLARRLRGEELTGTRRHGKHLFVRAGETGWLRLHFGMTGELHAWSREEAAPEPEHVALQLDFADGSHLAWRIPRRFGEIGWVDDPDAFVEERGLGPDPSAEGFGLPEFRAALEGRRGMVKTTLMNQEVLAGLGNVYVDEILFRTRLDPEAPVDGLEEETIAALWRSTKRVIETAVAARVDPDAMPDSFLLPHRRGDGKCPRCGRALSRKRVGGRTTWWCARDQQRRH